MPGRRTLRFATVDADGVSTPAALRDDDSVVSLVPFGIEHLIDLVGAAPDRLRDVEERVADAVALFDGVAPVFLPPIPQPPRNIFCVGRNYREHLSESAAVDRLDAEPTSPTFFSKPWTSLIGHGGEISVDSSTTLKPDYEAEVGLIIGKAGSDISAADAWNHVFGLVLANDVSARDLQGEYGQWFKGKSLDSFCPMGPFIRTVASIDDIDDLSFQLTVNGEERQRGTLCDLIFDVPTVIAHLSRSMRLLPGDIILTGTPSGVGAWREPPTFLAHGDVVEITSPELGCLRNVVVGVAS